MARIGSKRQAPTQQKQNKTKRELSQFELFKKHGGIVNEF
jgi:hypothetical protein